MAKSKAIARHHTGVSPSRYQLAIDRAASLSKKVAANYKETDGVAITALLTGAAVAYANDSIELPTVMGIDPIALYSIVGYGLTRGKAGKSAAVARNACITAMGIAGMRAYERGGITES